MYVMRCLGHGVLFIVNSCERQCIGVNHGMMWPMVAWYGLRWCDRVRRCLVRSCEGAVMVWLCSAYLPAFHRKATREAETGPECVPMVCDTLRSSAGLYGALLRSDPTERPEEPAIILCIHSRRYERSPQRPGMGCGGTLPALIRSPFLRAENVPCLVRSALLPSMCIYEHVFIY